MRFFSKDLPDAIKRKLPPEEKKRLGSLALTLEELVERQEVRTERQLQNQIADYLRLKGIPFIRSRMDRKTTVRVGVLDFNCCVPPHGKFIGLEVKLPGESPTEEQDKEIEAINRAGGMAVIVSCLHDVKQVVDLFSQ